VILSTNFLYLFQKSTKIPAAKYFCRLCDYHCMSVEHCHRHIKDQRHVRLLSVSWRFLCCYKLVGLLNIGIVTALKPVQQQLLEI